MFGVEGVYFSLGYFGLFFCGFRRSFRFLFGRSVYVVPEAFGVGVDIDGGGDGRRGVAEEAGDGEEVGCTVIKEGAAGVAEFMGVQHWEAEGAADALHEREVAAF